MEETKAAPHMVEQVIKYSDGSETVIKYRGVIVDGVLITEKIEEAQVETEEAVITPEAAEEVAEESIEESSEIIG